MPDITILWAAAILGLVVAIVLILKKPNPVCSLFFGTIVSCLIGGASLSDTVAVLLSRTQSIMETVIRVLAAGMLVGVTMESGATESIANATARRLGEKKTILFLALSTTIITTMGVFIPIAVLIVVPIALSVGKSTGVSKLSLLITLSGDGRADNIIPSNPNTIITADGLDLPPSDVMIAGFIPVVFGLIIVVILTDIVRNKGSMIRKADLVEGQAKELLPLRKALIAPVLMIALLLLNPIGAVLNTSFIKNLNIDTPCILPSASVVGTVAIGRTK